MKQNPNSSIQPGDKVRIDKSTSLYHSSRGIRYEHGTLVEWDHDKWGDWVAVVKLYDDPNWGTWNLYTPSEIEKE
jgi:hypothetical protein